MSLSSTSAASILASCPTPDELARMVSAAKAKEPVQASSNPIMIMTFTLGGPTQTAGGPSEDNVDADSDEDSDGATIVPTAAIDTQIATGLKTLSDKLQTLNLSGSAGVLTRVAAIRDLRAQADKLTAVVPALQAAVLKDGSRLDEYKAAHNKASAASTKADNAVAENMRVTEEWAQTLQTLNNKLTELLASQAAIAKFDQESVAANANFDDLSEQYEAAKSRVEDVTSQRQQAEKTFHHRREQLTQMSSALIDGARQIKETQTQLVASRAAYEAATLAFKQVSAEADKQLKTIGVVPEETNYKVAQAADTQLKALEAMDDLTAAQCRAVEQRKQDQENLDAVAQEFAWATKRFGDVEIFDSSNDEAKLVGLTVGFEAAKKKVAELTKAQNARRAELSAEVSRAVSAFTQ